MKKLKKIISFIWKALIAVGIMVSFCFTAIPAMSSEGIDPGADEILQAMSSYLGGIKTLSMNADIDFEIITNEGQKLQVSAFSSVVMERPNKFHITRKGAVANVEFFFDGEVLTLLGKNLNVYSQTPISGTIEDAIVTYELETGIPAPGADLMFTDSYKVLSEDVTTGMYMGTAYVDGVECHHLAFREEDVDWQIWVKTGDEPLPMKYIITTKWLTGAPQYEIRLRDWNTSSKINDMEFKFSKPEGAKKVEYITVNEMGEITVNGEAGK